MRRTLLIVLAVTAVTAGAVAAAIALGTGGGSEAPAAAVEPPADLITAEPSITPVHALFGDPVLAEIVIMVDNRHVDPNSVLVGPRFAPFDRIGNPEITTVEAGATTILRYRFRLQCVSRGCLPGDDAREIELPAVELEWLLIDPVDQGRTTFRWPTVVVAARTDTAFREQGLPQISSLQAPPVSYERSPSTLRWLMLAGATALLCLVGGGVAWFLLRRRATAPAAEAVAAPFALDDALAGVEDAATSGDARARRTALGRLAELPDVGALDGVASRARALAWSRDEPAADAMSALVEEIRAAGGAQP